MSYIYRALDSDEGNGSRSAQEDWIDGNNRIEENKWSSSQTTFWPDAVDGKGNSLSQKQQRKFEELKTKHDRFAGEDETYNRKTTIRYGHIMNDVFSFCNYCELPEHQTEAVANIIKNTDISSNNYGGKNYEKIILAVMSIIVDRDIDTINEFDERLFLDTTFRELMENNNLGTRELRKIRQMVRERVDVYEDSK